jgi:hypothetical protein
MSDSAGCVLAYRLLDYTIAITVPDTETGATLHAVLSGFPAAEVAAGTARYAIGRDAAGAWWVDAHGSRILSGVSRVDALLGVEWHAVSDVLAATPHLLHLHGAALATPSGDGALLVLGASGAGKTTLVLALMTLGFVPFADDVVLVEPDSLAVQTFPRAFHADETTRTLVERLPGPITWRFDGLPPGCAQPLRWASQPAPVSAIVFPELRPGDAPSLTRLSIADATATLLPFSGTLGSNPALALSVAAKLTGSVGCYTLRSGDLPATCALVASLAAGSLSR